MAKRESPANQTKALTKLDGEPWRGDDHELRLAAAREAGLAVDELGDVEIDLFTEGFKAGMVVNDPDDHAIVLRGRTVLRENQMSKALSPTLRFLRIPKDQVALRIHDGEFELRVARSVAEAERPALEAAKEVLKLWIGGGLLGFIAWHNLELTWLAALVWGATLVTGGYLLRKGAVTGRALLAARLTVSLALLAKEEKLILPPAKPADANPGRG